jgi:hypothetical protein
VSVATGTPLFTRTYSPKLIKPTTNCMEHFLHSIYVYVYSCTCTAVHVVIQYEGIIIYCRPCVRVQYVYSSCRRASENRATRVLLYLAS